MSYRFDVPTLHEIARKAVGLPHDEMFAAVTEALAATWPGHIHGDTAWQFSSAGGTVGTMKLLHFGPREYLMFFGTPIGTEGHSGRHGNDVYEFVLDGEFWSYAPGTFTRHVIRAGEMSRLPAGESHGYRIADHAWMLEYGRGAIHSMGPYSLSGPLFVTQDYGEIWRTVTTAGRLFFRSLRADRRPTSPRA